MARAHPEAADRLDRGVRDCDRVGTERQRLGEVGRHPQAARRDERDVAPAAPVEMAPGARQRGDGRYGDIVSEDDRRCASCAAAAVKDDVVATDL